MTDRIETIELFPLINRELVDLLRSLSVDEFHAATQFPSWKVKDICAHLLDTSIRKLSSHRDAYRSPEAPLIASLDDLVEYVTALADRWASAFADVSPRILIELIEKYQDELYAHLKERDPLGFALHSVAWAGEEKSFNWFDTAREYTERWHHQMQIREAVGRKPLYERKLYFPVLDTFMRALPYHYRDQAMERGSALRVDIVGEAGGSWFLEWNDGLELKRESALVPRATVRIDQADAWKIFTRWTDRGVYAATVTGDEKLGKHILEMNCLLIKQDE